MQTCSNCNASSPDDASNCTHCGALLSEYSSTSVALKRMQENPRVRSIRISVSGDACPYCYEKMKTYPKNKVPKLPHEGCSTGTGCRCYYEPVLEDSAIVGKVES
jgi:hypothetical protein